MTMMALADLQAGVPERRAALLVHALPPADREWLLESLPADQKASLASLLQELQDMNVPPDAQWLQTLLQPADGEEAAHAPFPFPAVSAASAYGAGLSAAEPPLASPGAAAPRQSTPAPARLMSLGPAGVAALARLLGQEPLPLAVRFLRLHDWPWRDKLLAQMGAGPQMQLRQALRDAGPGWDAEAPAPLLDQALMEVLARRIDDATGAVSPAAWGPAETPSPRAAGTGGHGGAPWWRRLASRLSFQGGATP